jgi:hypothetical protein
MYVDRVDEMLSEKEKKKDLLGRCESVEWKPKCRVDFTAVA